MLRQYIYNKERGRNARVMNEAKIIATSELPNNFDIEFVSNEVCKNIPKHILSFVDVIYVANLDEFETRSVNALYLDGAIFVSPKQDSEQDMIDDIVHEFAHSVEENLGNFLYSDFKIQKEFLLKRSLLARYLEVEGFSIPETFLRDIDFNQEIDDFLYKEVGYKALEKYINGIFLAPYAVTSVREYWAVGFEHYFLYKLPREVKAYCPHVYNKIKLIEDKRNFER